MSSAPFLNALEVRRSQYALSNKASISDAKIEEIVQRAVTHVPSSYNTQTSRAVVVLGEKNVQLWDALWEAHKANLPAELQETFKGKFDGSYKTGYGTIAFFEDQAVVDATVEAQPALAGIYPTFTQNTAGALQVIVWTALANEGMGATLQHYGQFGPANAEALAKFLDIPASWKSTGLMPFGVAAEGATLPEKAFQPIAERVKVVA
ncbi:uncharacterized protein EHS24_009120 [Apiotrichum porosum]|uniref:Nitroreductase domain-containing protein n=1 Tax=Apiotrichum porosum TaxID=105984 RepID=A0A427XNQ2_9TREE|nr:uncharacterized protein EHS24_009120 [Apiotrichum porosum]RSH80539.1 hypothetical protein EHS24_009120 [Apiotrichum porosum]